MLSHMNLFQWKFKLALIIIIYNDYFNIQYIDVKDASNIHTIFLTISL